MIPVSPFDDPTAPRLATVMSDGSPRLAVGLYGRVIDLAAALPDVPQEMVRLIADWSRWCDAIRGLDANAPTFEPESFAPPVTPSKVLCVGANYHDHVAEMAGPAGVPVTDDPFPFGFLKPLSALTGSGAEVVVPAYSRKLDWEAELAVIIGDGTKSTGSDPLDAVFGYTLFNDLSCRDFLPFPHALGLDAVVAKGFDGAGPIGPWITLAQDVSNVEDLPVQLRVNGSLKQDSSTAQLIFGVADIVAHYGRVLTLSPGDVIATGTPAGVGAGRTPPEFLGDGDVVEISIGDLGTLSTSMAAAAHQTSLTIERHEVTR
jgi:2,4-diketo-3-deoxy-L-fuconate hydrolase